MKKLERQDLLSLEQYAEERTAFRARVMEHKKHRYVPLGPHAALHFEDRLTIQYQVQEMLRIERIYERAAIQDELDTYNPLIPDGHNLKATFMVEYEDPRERKAALAKLIGIEDRVWVRVEGFEPVFAIADEDMERETEEKTSSVHFLRFELNPAMCQSLKGGAALGIGVDHVEYRYAVDALPAVILCSLVGDLD